jgi:hypothetical protein
MRASAFVMVSLIVGSAASVAGDTNPNAAVDRPISLGELTPTPEMWFYQQQQKQYENPKLAVRQKAEYRAAQRQLRLAARRWYGVDNSRPTTITTPFQGETYSGRFAGGRDPNLWPSVNNATIVVPPKRDGYRSTW